jgi:16S rRNA (guanine527-N7)-methyltransferase
MGFMVDDAYKWGSTFSYGMPNERQRTLLLDYVRAVTSAPESICLTATKDAQEFWNRHLLDAVKILEILPSAAKFEELSILDLGSGNGIPGLPLGILLEMAQVTLLDSNNKKCGFLESFCRAHGIENISVLCGRAEELGHQELHRGQYSVVVARAVAQLSATLELAVPFLQVGGLLIVPHGTSYEEALKQSKKAMSILDVEVRNVLPYTLGDQVFYHLLFIKKMPTSPLYPRRVGMPAKRPL